MSQFYIRPRLVVLPGWTETVLASWHKYACVRSRRGFYYIPVGHARPVQMAQSKRQGEFRDASAKVGRSACSVVPSRILMVPLVKPMASSLPGENERADTAAHGKKCACESRMWGYANTRMWGYANTR
eukprot:3580404-Pleurochrysis_carterae.AAC.2